METLQWQGIHYAAGYESQLYHPSVIRAFSEMLSEMRGAFSAEDAIPFLCLAKPEDDTSDRLMSPHLLGVEGACAGALVVAEWVGCVIRETAVARVMIWFTEGFDDAFERHDCGVEDAAGLLVARIRQENEVPSILLSISQK